MPATPIPKRLVSSELIDLAAAAPAAFVAMCENSYAARVRAAAGQVIGSGCSIVMLTGPSSSGKTTSANRLAAAIAAEGRPTAVISLDDFFVGAGRYPKRANGEDDYECLQALDLPLLRACLSELSATGRCKAPQFDFVTQRPMPAARQIDCRGGVTIIEGLHAFNPSLTEQLPQGSVYRIYAGLREEYCGDTGARTLCTRDVRLARRLVRDSLFRGHPAQFTLEVWPHVCQAENQYIRVYKETADLLLDTSFSYEICLWKKLLAPMLAAMDPALPCVRELAVLCDRFDAVAPLGVELVPKTSMLREFIG